MKYNKARSTILRESSKLTKEFRVKEAAGPSATSLRTGTSCAVVEVEADGRVFVTVRFLNENCPLLRNTDTSQDMVFHIL